MNSQIKDSNSNTQPKAIAFCDAWARGGMGAIGGVGVVILNNQSLNTNLVNLEKYTSSKTQSEKDAEMLIKNGMESVFNGIKTIQNSFKHTHNPFHFLSEILDGITKKYSTRNLNSKIRVK
jgi:hypothetical protein